MTSKIIDISPTLDEDTAVWPGDQQMSRKIVARLEDGSSVYLSGLSTTVHIGAHADAPSHYHQGAPDIDAVALDAYVGECLVMTVKSGPLVTLDDIASALLHKPKRLLLKTKSCPDRKTFRTDFTAISPAVIDALGAAGCVLVGIDTPSVDPFASKTLDAHQALWRWKMRNLEGLVLDHVADGKYELIALPLKLANFDASPVRAILRQL